MNDPWKKIAREAGLDYLPPRMTTLELRKQHALKLEHDHTTWSWVFRDNIYGFYVEA